MKQPYQIQPKTRRKSRIQSLLCQFWISGPCLIASVLCVLIPGTAPSQAKNPSPSLPSPPTESAQNLDFSADHVVDQVSKNRIILTGNVVLKFQDLEIRAGKVVFDRSSGTITAEPSSEADSTGSETGRPYFARGTEKFSGSRMVYDIASKKGRVWDGRVISQKRYHFRGEHALLDSLENIFLKSLSISTCDADHEHYRFQVGRLKIIENDKAIARNVTFELGPVPLMWIPFYVFPLQKGRR